MKRISRDPQRFELMRIFDQYARSRGVDIQDPGIQAPLMEELHKQFEANRKNEILIHGLRIQTMFAFVAAALGTCRMIKEEDAGDCYSLDAQMRAPDFRIFTLDGHELLVEVKNCNTSDFKHVFRLSQAYLDGLKNYASICQKELFIAIYWSRLAHWTLVSPLDFELRDGDYTLPMLRAMAHSNMALLGDCEIGTTPSLTMKLLSDRTKPRTVDASGEVNFTIGDVEFYSGDRLIEEDAEKNIAWFLMNYGKWPGEQIPAEVEDGQLIATGFRIAPEERSNPDENFEIIGSLSEMVSREFNDITAPDGAIKLLSPQREPDALGVLTPPDYHGKALPLWRLIIKAPPRDDQPKM